VSSPDPSPTPDLDALLKRLQRVERQRGILLFVACLAFAFSGANLALGYARPGPPPPAMPQVMPQAIVEAERLVLRDAAGTRRAVVEPNGNQPGLAFSDSLGNKWASLGLAHEGGASLSLYDRNGKARVRLAATQGSGLISLANENEIPLLTMASYGMKPHVVLNDQNQRTFLELDHSGLGLFQGSDKHRKFMLGTDEGGVAFSLYDANEKPRLAMMMSKNGPTLFITAENGFPLFAKP
jgi:hypothetical protein